VADIVVAVQVAVVLVVLVVLVLLHSLTPQVAVEAEAVTVQISAGIVIQDILAVQAAADLLDRIIVPLTEQVAAAAQVLTDKEITVLAVARLTAIVLVQVDNLVLTVLAVFLANLGQMVKDMAITVAETMVVAVADQEHHTVAVGAAKALFVLFGQQQERTQITRAKIFI
jgi:hypothetical protein